MNAPDPPVIACGCGSAKVCSDRFASDFGSIVVRSTCQWKRFKRVQRCSSLTMASQSRWIGVYALVWLVACYYLEPVLAQSSGQVVKILAVFDQADMEMMTRVLHKTLAAHNKENNPTQQWTSPTTTTTTPTTKTTSEPPSSNNNNNMKPSNSKRLRKNVSNNQIRMEAVIFPAPWWINQTADDLCSLLLNHKPVAILALAEEKVVFQVAVAASGFDIPIIGIRSGRDLDDSSFQVSLLRLLGIDSNRKSAFSCKTVPFGNRIGTAIFFLSLPPSNCHLLSEHFLLNRISIAVY